MPKPYLLLLAPVIFFLSLFTYVKLAGPIPFAINSVTTTKSDTFQVSAEGESSMPPDSASLSVGVQANGPTVKAAQDALNSNINKVSQAIKTAGVDAKDIQTQNYNINPSYDYSAGQKITGYSASTNLSITVRQIDKVNQVIDAATAAGANQVGGINFEVSDKTAAQNEARQKAVAEAKSKAEQAAKVAGFRLGRLVNYNENFGDQPCPIPMLNSLNVASKAPTQVQPGSSSIHVTVTLSYEIF